VELRGERVDLGAVEALRRVDVEAADYVLRDPVALLLGLEDVAGHPGLLRPCVEHVLEQLRPPQDVGAGLGECVEIDRVPACRRAKRHFRQATRGLATNGGQKNRRSSPTPAAASAARLAWRSINSDCMPRGGSPFTVRRDQTPSPPSSHELVLSTKARSRVSVSWSRLPGSSTGVTSSTRL